MSWFLDFGNAPRARLPASFARTIGLGYRLGLGRPLSLAFALAFAAISTASQDVRRKALHKLA